MARVDALGRQARSPALRVAVAVPDGNDLDPRFLDPKQHGVGESTKQRGVNATLVGGEGLREPSGAREARLDRTKEGVTQSRLLRVMPRRGRRDGRPRRPARARAEESLPFPRPKMLALLTPAAGRRRSLGVSRDRPVTRLRPQLRSLLRQASLRRTTSRAYVSSLLGHGVEPSVASELAGPCLPQDI